MTDGITLQMLSREQCTRFEELVESGTPAFDAQFVELIDDAHGQALGLIPAPVRVNSKLELALALESQLEPVFSAHPNLREDPQLWNALTLLWLPHVAGSGWQQGSEFLVFRRAGRDRYRHRLAGPYFLRQRFGGNAQVDRLLSALAADAHGEFLEQLLGRQYVFVSEAAWEAAARMYLDDSGHFKRGVLGRGGGSVRRFGVVVQQLAVTYNTAVMNADTLLALLPEEFNRFLS